MFFLFLSFLGRKKEKEEVYSTHPRCGHLTRAYLHSFRWLSSSFLIYSKGHPTWLHFIGSKGHIVIWLSNAQTLPLFLFFWNRVRQKTSKQHSNILCGGRSTCSLFKRDDGCLGPHHAWAECLHMCTLPSLSEKEQSLAYSCTCRPQRTGPAARWTHYYGDVARFVFLLGAIIVS